MKIAIILFALGVGYVSLPVTWHVAALGETTEAEPTPATAEPIAPKADDEKPKKDKDKSADKSDADNKDAKAKNTDEAKPKPEAKTESPAAEKKAEPAEAKKKERKTAKAESKRMKVVVTLDGTFTAVKMTPVELRPKAWSQFEIVEIVDHGTEVHAGQTLVKFDTEKFDEELAELQLQLNVSELAIRKSEEALPRLEKTLAMAATEAERDDKQAHEDFDHFHKIERPMLLKSVAYSLKNAQFQLDYQQDELDQLEKMYEADDLTEDTEEIVLKRSRTQVDFAKFSLEQTKQYCDELLQISLPRYEIRIKESLDKAALNMAQAKAALALDVNRARYDLEQQREARTKSLNRHAKLLADRALMEIKAPADGIVYYGECENGSWSDMSSLISKLKPHNNVSPDTVVMTIVERRPLDVAAQVGESQRPNLAVGQPAQIVTPVENIEWLPAKLESITAVPVATGKFNVGFDLTGTEIPDWIVAGMSCKVKITTYDKEDALLVPKKAVHTDKDDEQLKYVWLTDSKDAEAKPERRTVKLGTSSGDNVEIASGLKAGDVVSLDDEEKKDEDAE
jgi:multidrug efflux pump subunit AcrA (membrane-fusion protein)